MNGLSSRLLYNSMAAAICTKIKKKTLRKYLGKYESTKLSTLAGCKFNHPILFHIDITNNWQCEADLVHIAVATAPLIKDVVVVALKLICLFLNIRPATLKAAKGADRVDGPFMGIVVPFNGLPK